MLFRCERCGKRYSTSQEIREGRAYRFTCRACGHAVVVRAPAAPPVAAPAPPSGNGAPGNGAQGDGAARFSPTSSGLAAGAAASQAREERDARDLPPPRGGYVDFTLDDEVVTSGPITSSVPAVPGPPPGVEPPASAESSGAPDLEGAAPGRRRGGRKPPLIVAVIGASALAGAIAASMLFSGAGRTRRVEDRSGLPGPPGLLKPTVYVGPISLEPPRAATEPVPPPSPPPRAGPAPRKAAAPRPSRTARSAPPAREEARPRALAAGGAAPPAPAPAAEPVAPEPAPPPVEARPQPAAAVQPAPEPEQEEAPAYPREGFRRPAPEARGCIESGLRVPRDLADHLPPAVTLRFAVTRDGGAELVQVLGEGVDPRLAKALESAVKACRFVPGADERGNPIRLWVVMPIRFG